MLTLALILAAQLGSAPTGQRVAIVASAEMVTGRPASRARSIDGKWVYVFVSKDGGRYWRYNDQLGAF